MRIEDRVLIDGGLAMNLPIAAVREMGAEVVIAVNVSRPRPADEVDDLFAMLEQVASLVTWRNTQEQIRTLQPGDVLISPPLGREVGAFDFNEQLTAVAAGRRGAQEKAEALAALSPTSGPVGWWPANARTTASAATTS